MTVQTIHQPAGLISFPSPDEISAIEAQVEKYARSNLLPSAIRGKANDVFTVLMVARDLGLPATSGLFKVHVVDGKPTLAADLMVALALSHGHDVWIEETSNESATAKAQRKGSQRIQTITYTLEDAQRAGLAGKDNWKKNPAAMLRARALGGVCRLAFPDVLGGIAATTEELEDERTAAPAEPVDPAAAAAKLKIAAEAQQPPAAAEVVDGELVPDPTSTDAPADEVANRVGQHADAATAASTPEDLRAVWDVAEQEGLLDEEVVDGHTLRGIITEHLEALRGQQ